MQVSYCDICQRVIKNVESKYIMTINEIKEENIKSVQELFALLSRLENKKKELRHYEVCKDCKKIFDYLFLLRKVKLKALKEEIEKLFKKNKYGKLGDLF